MATRGQGDHSSSRLHQYILIHDDVVEKGIRPCRSDPNEP